MKNEKIIWNEKNEKVIFWSEERKDGKVDYWRKVDGVSQSISKTQYNNLVKKYEEWVK